MESMAGETYNSLLRWLKEVLNNITEEDLKLSQEDRAYKWYNTYSQDVPAHIQGQSGAPIFTPMEKGKLIGVMESVNERVKDRISIVGQSHQDATLEDAINDGARDFAFYMSYKDNNSVDASEGEGRLTLSFDPKKADKAFELLGTYLKSVEKTKTGRKINSLKVLGPDYQGTRTDSGIIYLNTSDNSVVEQIGKELAQLFGSAGIQLYDHTPMGMKRIDKGMSFSQRGPYSSSHGFARAKIIDDAVNVYLKGGKMTMEQALTEAIKRNGYDEEDPSILKEQNYIRNYDFIEMPMDERVDKLLGFLQVAKKDENDYIRENERVSGDLSYLKAIRNQGNGLNDDDFKRALVYGAVGRYKGLFGADEDVEKWIRELTEKQAQKYILLNNLNRQLSQPIDANAPNAEELRKQRDEATASIMERVNNLSLEINKALEDGRKRRGLVKDVGKKRKDSDVGGIIGLEEVNKDEDKAKEQANVDKIGDDQSESGSDASEEVDKKKKKKRVK